MPVLRRRCRSLGIALLALASVCAPAATQAAPEQPHTWRNVQILGGGFIPGIVFSEAEAGLVYARTDIGGAYRMDNASNGEWVPMLDWIGPDQWNYTGVLSLAPHPTNANIVYCAVGTYINSWEPGNGAILKSTDRGATWSTYSLPFKVGGNMPGRGCGERLAIDPNQPNILFLGAEDAKGLWKSTDGGATWSQVTSFPNPGNYIQTPGNVYAGFSQGIYWVTFDKRTGTAGSATQTLYVGVADLDNTLYKSTDGGASWTRVANQPTGYMAHKGRLDATNGYLYLATSDKGGPYDGGHGQVWRLDTATGAWTDVSPIPLSSGDNTFGYSGLTIDKQNPATVMVTAYSCYWPDTMIWRSNDSGATWTRIWDWNGYPNRSFRYTLDYSASPWIDWGTAATPPEVRPKLGWMTESLEIDPFNRNRMMYGTGATLYGTTNLLQWDSGGQITIRVMAKGIEETAIQDLISPPSGPQLFSGMLDLYGFTHTNVDVVPAKLFLNPSINTLSIDFAESNPNLVVRSGTGDNANNVKFAAYSTDAGDTWSPVGSQPSGVSSAGTIAISADGARILWAAGGASVSYSTNNGSAWTASSGIPSGAEVRADRVNAAKFYGLSGGSFYVSTNGGTSFTSTASGLPTAGQFRCVPGHEGHIWISGGAGGLWRSIDSGASFTRVTTATEADTIGFGKAAPGQTYPAVFTMGLIDGVRGVFRSDDAGAAWVRVNDAQHQYGIPNAAIAGDPRIYGRVYLATNGRGIVYADITNSQPTAPSAPTNVAATAGNAQVSLTWTASAGATSYNVKRATTNGGPYTTVASGITTASYTNTGLTNGTTYYFVVTAVNSVGESANSSQVSATPQALTLPPAPTNLTATGGKRSVTLRWTAASGATSYNVKRATTSGGPYTTVATGVTGTSYTNGGLSNRTTYYFVVSAVNAAGESANSNQASARPN